MFRVVIIEQKTVSCFFISLSILIRGIDKDGKVYYITANGKTKPIQRGKIFVHHLFID